MQCYDAGGQARLRRSKHPVSSRTISEEGARRLHRLKRLGAVGFLFFLLKGLLWLIVPLVMAWIGYTA